MECNALTGNVTNHVTMLHLGIKSVWHTAGVLHGEM